MENEDVSIADEVRCDVDVTSSSEYSKIEFIKDLPEYVGVGKILSCDSRGRSSNCQRLQSFLGQIFTDNIHGTDYTSCNEFYVLCSDRDKLIICQKCYDLFEEEIMVKFRNYVSKLEGIFVHKHGDYHFHCHNCGKDTCNYGQCIFFRAQDYTQISQVWYCN